jgi:hypothetical protein
MLPSTVFPKSRGCLAACVQIRLAAGFLYTPFVDLMSFTNLTPLNMQGGTVLCGYRFFLIYPLNRLF